MPKTFTTKDFSSVFFLSHQSHNLNFFTTEFFYHYYGFNNSVFSIFLLVNQIDSSIVIPD